MKKVWYGRNEDVKCAEMKMDNESVLSFHCVSSGHNNLGGVDKQQSLGFNQGKEQRLPNTLSE